MIEEQIMSTKETSLKQEVDIGQIRWIMYLANGKAVVENHNHGRTWKKAYKDNLGAIQAVCFQIIPKSEKVFISASPFGEYWSFEEMFVTAGSSTPHHNSRTLCSKQEVSVADGETYWDTITVFRDGTYKHGKMTGTEIGYSTLEYQNIHDRNWV